MPGPPDLIRGRHDNLDETERPRLERGLSIYG